MTVNYSDKQPASSHIINTAVTVFLSVLFTVFNETVFTRAAPGTVLHLLLFLNDYPQVGNLMVLLALYLNCGVVTFVPSLYNRHRYYHMHCNEDGALIPGRLTVNEPEYILFCSWSVSSLHSVGRL